MTFRKGASAAVTNRKLNYCAVFFIIIQKNSMPVRKAQLLRIILIGDKLYEKIGHAI